MSNTGPGGRLSWSNLKQSNRKVHKRKSLNFNPNHIQKIEVLDLSFGEFKKPKPLSKSKFKDPLQQLNEWLRSQDKKTIEKDEGCQKEKRPQDQCFKQTSISRFFSRMSSEEKRSSPKEEGSKRGQSGQNGWSRSHSYLMIKRMNRRKEKMALNQKEEMQMEFRSRKQIPIHNTQHQFYKPYRVKTEPQGPLFHVTSPLHLAPTQPAPLTLKTATYHLHQGIIQNQGEAKRCKKEWAIKVLKQRNQKLLRKNAGNVVEGGGENNDSGICPWVRSNTRNQDVDFFS